MNHQPSISLAVSPPLTNGQLNQLFAEAWPEHREADFQQVLRHSLAYIAAFQDQRLVGFVNVAWDGGIHAFVLDPTVHSSLRRQGLGRRLIERAASVAQARGIQWLHVDYEPQLAPFYASCGFSPSAAGILWLGPEPAPPADGLE